MAASATFALKAGVWFRRARLLIVSPDSRANLARRQAETPLIALFRFPQPALKGYLAMGIVMLIQSCVTLTKTVRDMHESGKLVNRIEDAKAERILMDVSKAA